MLVKKKTEKMDIYKSPLDITSSQTININSLYSSLGILIIMIVFNINPAKIPLRSIWRAVVINPIYYGCN